MELGTPRVTISPPFLLIGEKLKLYKRICIVVALTGLLSGILGLTVHADVVPLPADQVKIVGTTQDGVTALLLGASGYYLDWFNQHPTATEVATGRMYHRVATRYGWSYTYVNVVASCAPDNTYATYTRPKTFFCSIA